MILEIIIGSIPSPLLVQKNLNLREEYHNINGKYNILTWILNGRNKAIIKSWYDIFPFIQIGKPKKSYFLNGSDVKPPPPTSSLLADEIFSTNKKSPKKIFVLLNGKRFTPLLMALPWGKLFFCGFLWEAKIKLFFFGGGGGVAGRLDWEGGDIQEISKHSCNTS